ncbi:Calcium-dependent lipid-binding (CaLB domain) family protein [Abeliophyllum distichum]|uniref:Calcium-dependent lipid-binding (CaLB domain) family protein n=1 Tax=Abeliophyllum distichum TaxID=126358 RepID=A0ABD1P458_9LAMI
MESTIQTPTASSAVTTSSISNQVPPFHLLEISVISAQNLAPVSKSMRTYAVTWVHPSRKLTTRTAQKGQTNPTWNDKFAFRVDDEFLLSDNAAVNVEIYTVSWFCDVLVGIVRVPICELITPSVLTQKNSSKNTRFVALQVRRPSGTGGTTLLTIVYLPY